MRHWLLAALVLAITGCSAASTLPVHPQSQSVAIQSGGGVFHASYSGQFTRNTTSGCGTTHDVFSFSGSGRGAFIHDSTESGQVISFRSTCAWTGAATLVSSENPNNSITVAYNAVMQKGHDPCDHIVNFVVGRGTGKFANVKGSGTVRFACTGGTSGTYVDHWAGSITF